MATLTVTSGLAGFRLIQGITHVDEQEIIGRARFKDAPLYTGLEAMAQLGALDVRRRIVFAGHAFLLKIVHSDWPRADRLDGAFHLEARPGSRSQRAFQYHTRLRGPTGPQIEAELMFGVVDYDNDFQKQHLQAYYRDLFTCLRNATSES